MTGQPVIGLFARYWVCVFALAPYTISEGDEGLQEGRGVLHGRCMKRYRTTHEY